MMVGRSSFALLPEAGRRKAPAREKHGQTTDEQVAGDKCIGTGRSVSLCDARCLDPVCWRR